MPEQRDELGLSPLQLCWRSGKDMGVFGTVWAGGAGTGVWERCQSQHTMGRSPQVS